jgi:hypothetical protein
MAQRRDLLLGAVSGALTACGGAAGPAGYAAADTQLPLVGCIGDSLFSGGVHLSPSGDQTGWLSPRPVLLMRRLLGVDCIDYSRGGFGAAALLSSWGTDLLVEPSRCVVLRLGGADAIGGVDPAQFERDLDQLVALARAAGKAVVLPGLPWMARRPDWQDPIGMTQAVYIDRAERAAAMNTAVRRVASAADVPFVDIRSLPFTGPTDLADAVHLGQDYANRCVAAIAAAVRPLL